ncbi:ABC transporter ATP-binding protein [Planktotalea arctica]|uniref:ABC transporter ATP-binding protein n=1 Tax=Planktotalea arctica TaxID=1481893 RepID=UPI001C38D0C5|nr:ABC transporter ATP-binding protein [Planktotalea arctica]
MPSTKLENPGDVAIRVTGLGKTYKIHDAPSDRLKEMLIAPLRRRLGLREKSYSRTFKALQDVSFELRKGETTGIIGRNGSGKSTLLQIICGTLAPSEGTVEVNGRVAALLELGSGFNPDFTGRENVYMNGAILGLSEAEIDAKFASIHAFSEIGDFIERPVKTYSSGMMVRLAFAVIAHVDADILVVDEALSVGDAFFVQKCMRFLRKFMETGTVLFVSHDTGAVINLCNYAVWLEAGKMMGQGSPKGLSEAYLEKQYESMQDVVRKQTSASDLDAERPGKEQSHFSPAVRDMRADLIAGSTLRNDLEVFAFDETATGFGAGGAHVDKAQMCDANGAPLSWIVGGEAVQLHVQCSASADLRSPIVGFILRDRLGQTLFGDNTYLSHHDKPIAVAKGAQFAARFDFQMPLLPQGDYTLSLAVADGTQDEHVQHYWLHDAINFKSHASSVSTGLVGVPMQNIRLETR